MYECLFGKAPYKSETLEQLLIKIQSEAPIVIPRSTRISESCRDLLTRCLERDPSKRIDFEDFFQHDFLDLEHLPSEESHDKAVTLINQAVKLDQDKQLEEALELYRAALEYLVPIVQLERNVVKKAALRKKADQYVQRAETIKKELGQVSGSPSGSFDFSSNSSSVMMSSIPSKISKIEELVKMSQNTPNLKTGVEIAQSAELYDFEGQHGTALDKYQSALGVLIPLLANEPKGDRKTLLNQEIKRWMNRAETIKDLKALEDKCMSDSICENANLDKQCLIQ